MGHHKGYSIHKEEGGQMAASPQLFAREEKDMKGYAVDEGYMGYVEGRYMLFADEGDYREFMEEELA